MLLSKDFLSFKFVIAIFTIFCATSRVLLSLQFFSKFKNLSNKTFICDSDFNIYTYLELCLQKFSIKTPEPKYYKNNDNQDYLDHEQRINCKIENIEFFDCYYKIWIVENEKKVKNIQPLIITDPNSQECLQIVSKYFENRIPNDVMIVFTSKKV